jgi:hypothetical protein
VATRRIPTHAQSNNGEPSEPGDAYEPVNAAADAAADAGEFDLADLEAQNPPAAESPEPEPADDVWDLDALRLDPDDDAGLGLQKALLTLPVRTPDRSWWIRVHPTHFLNTAVIELKEEREVYLVAPAIRSALGTESTRRNKTLVLAVNRQRDLFIWPINLPGPDGRTNDWNKSALAAAALARKGWIRVQANMSLGAYEVWQTTATVPDPIWPNLSLPDLLKIAFRDKFIGSLDHPVLKRLRGEV